MNDDLKDLILSTFEASLEAQLRAVRRLRQGETTPPHPSRRGGLSQIDMAYDVLKKARSPLHVSEILARIQAAFWRHRRSRKPRLLAHQKGRAGRSLPAHREKHLQLTPGGPMTLLAAFLKIVADWHSVFPQSRTWKRAVRPALGSRVCWGRRCLT